MRDGAHPGKTVEHLHYHLMPNLDLHPHPVSETKNKKAKDEREMLTDLEVRELLDELKKTKHS